MSDQVYIRPLTLDDAQISYRWRNDPRIWRLTGSRPDGRVTPELETEWLTGVLARSCERRFAICLAEDDKYIGNTYLTDITTVEAQLHIFIGEPELWASGIATQALRLMVRYGFDVLGLQVVYGYVREGHTAMLTASGRVGPGPAEEREGGLVKLVITRTMYETSYGRTTERPAAP